jgi:hypothetical protein
LPVVHVNMLTMVKKSVFFDSIWKGIENIEDVTWIQIELRYFIIWNNKLKTSVEDFHTSNQVTNV